MRRSTSNRTPVRALGGSLRSNVRDRHAAAAFILFLTLVVLTPPAVAGLPQNPLPATIDLRPPFRSRPWSVTEGENGSLVVGGVGTIGIFDGMRWRHIRIPQIEAARTTTVKNGRIWIGTRGQVGWIDANSDDGVFHPVITDIPGEVFYVIAAGDNILAVSFDLVVLIAPDGTVRDRHRLPVAMRRFLYSWDDGWLLSGATDAFFIRAKGGLTVSAETPVPKELLTQNRIVASVAVDDKVFLFGARNSYVCAAGRLNRVDAPDWSDLASEHLITVFRPPGADAPILRLGVDGGLKAFDPHTLRFLWQLRSGEELPGAPVCAPVVTPFGIFFGADTAVCWIPSVTGARQLSHSRQRVNTLQAGPHGLWVCTTEGSWRVAADSWSATDAAPGSTWSACETPFGTLRGLFRSLDVDGRRVQVDIGGAQIMGLAPSRDGFVANELVRLSRWNPSLRMTDAVDVLAAATSIAVDREDTVYAGTIRSGLLRWPRGGPLEIVRQRGSLVCQVRLRGAELVVLWSDGLLEIGRDQVQLPDAPAREWNSVVCAGETIIVGGGFDHGAALLLLERRGGRWIHRPLEHPVLATIAHADVLAATADGVAVAGFGGSLELSRALFADELPPAVPRLTHVGAASGEDGAPKLRSFEPVAGELRLNADENELRFVVAGGPEFWRQRVRFFYRLAPESVEWTALDPSAATVLQRIGTGTHILEIEARSPAGTVPASFTVRRPPRWYVSGWALAAYLIAFAAAAVGAVVWRTRRLAARAKDLEMRVAQRTAELRRANEAKSEFLASMSHEIRNPLNGVIGLSDMLRDSARDERGRRLTEALSGCADQLRLVLDDILDFSLVERGEVHVQITSFDPVAAIHFAVIAIDPQMERTRIRIAPDVAGQFVRGDEGKLRQVVTNLISNAHKFGVPPEAELEVRWEQDRLVVAVTNTGPDIPAADRARIFASFERGRPVRHRPTRGTGLGLTICSRLARALGGDVTVQSENGLTRFTFSAPFERVSAPSPSRRSAALPRGGTVLAIEDETYNRLVLGHVLTGLGFEVDWAQNGHEALDILRSHCRYDAILTDWMLPDMLGGELVRQIREIAGQDTPAIIAVTAYATAEKRREAEAAGVSGFVTKPITAEKIALALRTIAPQRSERPASEPDEPLQLGILLEADHAVDRLADYRRQVVAQMAEIEDAVRVQDAARASRAAHQLAGQLLAIHHHTFADELRAFEAAVGRQDWDAAAELQRRNVAAAAALNGRLADLGSALATSNATSPTS